MYKRAHMRVWGKGKEKVDATQLTRIDTNAERERKKVKYKDARIVVAAVMMPSQEKKKTKRERATHSLRAQECFFRSSFGGRRYRFQGRARCVP